MKTEKLKKKIIKLIDSIENEEFLNAIYIIIKYASKRENHSENDKKKN
jgi:hypothetical protein